MLAAIIIGQLCLLPQIRDANDALSPPLPQIIKSLYTILIIVSGFELNVIDLNVFVENALGPPVNK